MKRQLALILAGVLALSLVGCSDQGGGSTVSQEGKALRLPLHLLKEAERPRKLCSGTMKLTLPE